MPIERHFLDIVKFDFFVEFKLEGAYPYDPSIHLFVLLGRIGLPRQHNTKLGYLTLWQLQQMKITSHREIVWMENTTGTAYESCYFHSTTINPLSNI